MQDTEIWKSVTGFEAYRISNRGTVINNLTNKVIKPNKWGLYPRVKLYKEKKRFYFPVHRLVALEFLPNPENKPCVLHKDNNPSNPISSNLYWGTYSDNNIQAIRDGRRKNKMGVPNPKVAAELSPQAIFTNLQVSVIKEALTSKHRQVDIARYFKTTRGTIWKIKAGYSWASVS